jgi:hypothetical protein
MSRSCWPLHTFGTRSGARQGPRAAGARPRCQSRLARHASSGNTLMTSPAPAGSSEGGSKGQVAANSRDMAADRQSLSEAQCAREAHGPPRRVGRLELGAGEAAQQVARAHGRHRAGGGGWAWRLSRDMGSCCSTSPSRRPLRPPAARKKERKIYARLQACVKGALSQ